MEEEEEEVEEEEVEEEEGKDDDATKTTTMTMALTSRSRGDKENDVGDDVANSGGTIVAPHIGRTVANRFHNVLLELNVGVFLIRICCPRASRR